MAARCILVLCGLWLSMTGAGICSAQEVNKELTAEEIVARHEASWGKLKRIRFDLETTTRLTIGSTSTRIGGNGKAFSQLDPRTTELHVIGSVYLDGDRVSSNFQTLSNTQIGIEHDGAEYRQERPQNAKAAVSRELIDKGLIVAISPGRVSIQNAPQQHPRVHAFLLGRGISTHMMGLETLLCDWVREERPTVSKKTSESGETCWVLTGKFKTNVTPTKSPSYRTDEVVVTINADRGFLIERIVFTSEKQEHLLSPKEIVWAVSKWQDLGGGASFPAKVEWELSYWNLPYTNWLKATYSNVQLDPADLEKQFQFEIAQDATVFDTTARSGTAPVSIWGANGKAKKLYVTREEFDLEQRAKNLAESAKRHEKAIAHLFPGCTLKVTWNEQVGDFQTIVYDEKGEVLHEFKNTAELAGVESVQELIRFAMGKKELK